MSETKETEEFSWLPLVVEHYGIEVKGEPILLNQRDQQRVFAIETSEGIALTLRLCAPSRPYEKVLADTEALLYLNRHNFPAPVLRPTRSGEPAFAWKSESWAYAHDFIRGETRDMDLESLRGLATLLGRLHTLANEADPYPAKINWLDDLGTAIKRAESSVSDALWGTKASEVAASLKNLPDLHGLPTGLTHTDPHEGNLLHTPSGQLYLLDWEDAGIGELILDLALVLGWLCVWPSSKDLNGQIIRYDFDPEWCKTFLSTYQQFRPITTEEAQALGAAIRFVVGWYAARDITREIVEPGISDGLAFTHWAIVRSVTPTWEKVLAQWAIETGTSSSR